MWQPDLWMCFLDACQRNCYCRSELARSGAGPKVTQSLWPKSPRLVPPLSPRPSPPFPTPKCPQSTTVLPTYPTPCAGCPQPVKMYLVQHICDNSMLAQVTCTGQSILDCTLIVSAELSLNVANITLWFLTSRE